MLEMVKNSVPVDYRSDQPKQDFERRIAARHPVLSELNAGYVSHDSAQVTSFLRDKPNLLIVLGDALKPIYEIFGKDSVVNLKVSRDHDGDAGNRFLLARIQSQYPLAESVALLDQFEEVWWVHQAVSTDGVLVFDVDVKA